MTALDLDAIKTRADKLHRAHIMGASREDSVSTYSEARDDIRALVAEVERLRGFACICPGVGPIGDWDGYDRACAVHGESTSTAVRRSSDSSSTGGQL